MASLDDVDRLHEAALELFDEAERHERRGLPAEAHKFFQKALEEETEAADLWARIDGDEPTRSILYRSAAAIALRAGEIAHAIVLCDNALASPSLPEEQRPDIHEIRDAAQTELEQLAFNARPESRPQFIENLQKKNVEEIERTGRNLSRLFEDEVVAHIWNEVFKDRARRRGDPLNPGANPKSLAKQASELPEGEAYAKELDKLLRPAGKLAKPFRPFV
jgi:hypothetical protein